MKSLTATSLFDLENRTSNIKRTLLSFDKNVDKIDMSTFEENILLIKKRFSFSLVQTVFNDIEDDLLILRKNQNKLIPTYIPSYMIVDDNKIKAVIPIDKYVSINKNKNMSIDIRVFYNLLQTASIMIRLHKNWNYTLFNQEIGEVGALCYSAIFSKVLDKLIALNLNSSKSDAVRYLSAKFFLLNLLERKPSENIENLSFKCCTANFISKDNVYNQVENFNKEKGFNSFIDFLTELFKMENLGMKGLTIRTYLQNYTQFYGPSALFALEYLPFFLHMLFACNIGSHINNDFMIESLLGKKIDQMYGAVSALVK